MEICSGSSSNIGCDKHYSVKSSCVHHAGISGGNGESRNVVTRTICQGSGDRSPWNRGVNGLIHARGPEIKQVCGIRIGGKRRDEAREVGQNGAVNRGRGGARGAA